MNNNHKRIIVSAVFATAFAAMSVGTTFALFTSKSDSAIDIGSGKLDVSTNITDFVTYSALADQDGDRVDENNHRYISQQTAVNGVFTNSGTAEFSDSVLTLSRITPGDRVTFNVNFVDNSNIDYKYRVVYKVVSEDETLAKGLVTKSDIDMQGEVNTYEGLLEFVSIWFRVSDHALPADGLSFDIELPIDKGNLYQDKGAQFIFALEAVQGNAYTENVEEKVVCGLEDLSQKAVAGEDDLTLQVSNKDDSLSVKTVIPASAEEVSAGDKVELLVTDMDLGTTSGGVSTLNLDVTLKVNGNVVSLFSEPVEVEIYVGEELQINYLKHNGVLVPASNYEYDSEEGVIRFSTSSFSPYEINYNVGAVITGPSMDMPDDDDDN